MKLTKENIIAKMKRRLGGIFCEELEAEDFEEALDSADRWFLTWIGGNEKEYVATYVSGERQVSVPDDCRTILEVILSGRSTDFIALLDPSSFSDSHSVPANIFRPGNGGGIGDISQTMAHVEMVSRVLGAERDWEYVRQQGIIRLYPAAIPASSGGYVYIRYSSSDISYERMSPLEQMYYLRWVEAELKKMLGRVRSKYSNLPGPGDNVEIADGQILLDEAKEEFQAIMEEVRQKPLGFIVG